jgi:hypothetical protein
METATDATPIIWAVGDENDSSFVVAEAMVICENNDVNEGNTEDIMVAEIDYSNFTPVLSQINPQESLNKQSLNVITEKLTNLDEVLTNNSSVPNEFFPAHLDSSNTTNKSLSITVCIFENERCNSRTGIWSADNLVTYVSDFQPFTVASGEIGWLSLEEASLKIVSHGNTYFQSFTVSWS